MTDKTPRHWTSREITCISQSEDTCALSGSLVMANKKSTSQKNSQNLLDLVKSPRTVKQNVEIVLKGNFFFLLHNTAKN